jgi:ABC-type uncharacterized transport system substrate-binding protein
MAIRIGRRQFLTLLGGAAAPLAARAQPAERTRRIALLSGAIADDPDTLLRISAFMQGLQELGWTIGWAASIMGLQLHALNARTNREIDAAFATFVHERPDALFVPGDNFFTSRRVQLVTLAARDRIPAAYVNRETVAAGGLMSYGTDLVDSFHQVGVYTGNILKGAKPADLPVVQATKFEFVINAQTARLLGMDVPPNVLALADEVIE